MANNEIKLTIKVDDDGSLKIVAKEAKAAAKSVEGVAKATQKAGKYQDTYLRGQKGVAGATSNSTKAFSKMNQGLSGSTGLVQSYAILASNIFAATAAFNALRRVAQVEQLGKGLQFVGNVAGRDLEGAAKRLTEITGSAVSMSQAMRTTAVGISAGFDSTQIEGLAKVAKGASIALGRDMADAMDRLVRGTAKLEPEILDELGIMVRLDTAAQKYATQLGVSVQSLSQYERQQAFLNETLEQGLKKYEDIAGAVDPNPYDKLAAALQNLAVNTVGAIDGTFKLSNGVAYLSDHMLAMTGVVTAALVPITRRLVPGMFDMAEASAKMAEKVAVSNRELLDHVNTTGKMPKVYGDAIVKIKEGTGTVEDFNKAQRSLNQSLQTNQRWLETYRRESGPDSDKYKQKAIDIDNIRKRQQELNNIQAGELQLSASRRRAEALELSTRGKIIQAVKLNAVANREYADSVYLANASSSAWVKNTGKLKVALTTLTTTVKTLGAAFLRFLPYIGLIITAGTVLYNFFKEKFVPSDLIDERLEEAKSSFSNFANITEQFAESHAADTTRLVNAYIAWAGILDEIKGKFRDVNDAAKEMIETQRRQIVEAIMLENERVRQAREHLASGEEDTFIQKFANLLLQASPLTEGSVFGGTLEGDIRTLETAESRIQSLNDAMRETNNILAKMQFQANFEVLTLAINELEALLAISPENGLLAMSAREDIEALRALQNSYVAIIRSGVEMTPAIVAALEGIFTKIQNTPNTIRDVFKSAQDAALKFNTEANKLSQKAKGPFDNIIDAADVIVKKFDDIRKQTDRLGIDEVNRLAKELETNFEGLNLPERFKDGEVGIRRYLAQATKARDSIADQTRELKALQQYSKDLDKVTKGIASAEGLRLSASQAAIQHEISLNNNKIDQLKRLANLSADELKYNNEISKLTADNNKLNEQLLTIEQVRLTIGLEALKVAKSRADLFKEEFDLAEKLIKLEKYRINIAAGRGGRLSAKDEYELSVARAQMEVEAAKQQFAFAEARYFMETELLKASAEFRGLAPEIQKRILEGLEEQYAIQLKILNLKTEGAAADLAAIKATSGAGESVFEKLGHATSQAMLETIEAALITGEKRIEASRAKYASAQQGISEVKAAMAGTTDLQELAALEEVLESFKTQSRDAIAEIAQNFLIATADSISPFLEKMRQLGPDGEVAAALTEGALVIGSALATIAHSGVDAADKVAAVGSVISAIGSIQKASSDQAIAAIDKQIDAEKRRDGKSKESLAKISALEKKKEAEKRKAFDKDKKAKMASIVIDTAAGMMKAVGQAGLFGIPMAAVIAAMGAVQLALVASQSYEGGSAGSPDQGVSKVSLGERNNTVDLARSSSPSGELAYMRGERGYGMTGANNYMQQPGGFAGKAVGGRTSFLVGEQGPELFIPDRPGTILPADETERVGGTYNVNFSINAIDTQGMEDALAKQQGNIIKLIREAANSQGEFFLENVNLREF